MAGYHPHRLSSLADRGRESPLVLHAQKAQLQFSDTPPKTPKIESILAHELVQEIGDLYISLSRLALTSLAPSPEVNSLLTRLVELCIEPRRGEVVNHVFQLKGTWTTLFCKLRSLCATAECELENHWAQQILNSRHGSSALSSEPKALLHSFPYYQNYLDLSRLECSTLEGFLLAHPIDSRPSPSRIAFIGSGPLPLTSFCMLNRYPKASVHNIDRDIDALRVSWELTMMLGYGERMTFEGRDVSSEKSCGELVEGHGEIADWSKFDVVFLAALVGMDSQSKIEILASLGKKLSPGTLVIARSAHGLREVLYPALELSEELHRIGFKILVVVHPWTKVVNSVIVLRVKGT
ncbi:Nicotianamine synthase [Lindgomyces ingoldianus]|uniref:Nicotianamine synthase n=1 Tax=Lindgomyces ingoldianus TaxID=673940 RepID=A0ACB6QE82_9PLEO|nr:Nicotianamine synthase [Lindgomyces ingoldianus]KAF2465258.1 Nicotianamine synthase [Lindgomyces ingoldianus]